MHSNFFFICGWWKDTELVHAIFAKILTFQRAPLPSHLNFCLQFGEFGHYVPILPFSPKSPLSKGPLCHLIWIFVYSLAILAINCHFCHFRQCVHFWTYLDYLGKYFIKRSAVDNNNTRVCNNFVVPRCRLSMGQRAFYFRGLKEWNGLPDNIRNAKDIDIFKRRLFNRIFHMKWFWISYE